MKIPTPEDAQKELEHELGRDFLTFATLFLLRAEIDRHPDPAATLDRLIELWKKRTAFSNSEVTRSDLETLSRIDPEDRRQFVALAQSAANNTAKRMRELLILSVLP